MGHADRDPQVVAILKHFDYRHLPPHLREVSQPVHDLAAHMVATIPDGPELYAGLRSLLIAKDAFVRAAIEAGTITPATAGTSP